MHSIFHTLPVISISVHTLRIFDFISHNQSFANADTEVETLCSKRPQMSAIHLKKIKERGVYTTSNCITQSATCTTLGTLRVPGWPQFSWPQTSDSQKLSVCCSVMLAIE